MREEKDIRNNVLRNNVLRNNVLRNNVLRNNVLRNNDRIRCFLGFGTQKNNYNTRNHGGKTHNRGTPFGSRGKIQKAVDKTWRSRVLQGYLPNAVFGALLCCYLLCSPR